MDKKIKTIYELQDKSIEPGYEYILLTNNNLGGTCVYLDYYLYKYDEFEEAISQLKIEYAKGNVHARICVPQFNTTDRTWRVKDKFKVDYNSERVVYLEYGDVGLHFMFYCNAGKWLNPRA